MVAEPNSAVALEGVSKTYGSVRAVDGLSFQVSAGRFLFGIGGGWNAEEMADHGTTDFKNRFKLMRERIEAMQQIWTQENAEYHGDLVDFGPMMCWPKPVQVGGPPVLMGRRPNGLPDVSPNIVTAGIR